MLLGNNNEVRKSVLFKDLERLDEKDPIQVIRAVFGLYAFFGSLDADYDVFISDSNSQIRACTIRMMADDGLFNKLELTKFRELAASDPSPVVRLALASALQRMPLEDRWPILEALVAHSEDSDDHNLPLMYWYAFEPMAAADPARALKLAQGAKVAKILPFTVRRVAAIGTPELWRP